MELFHKVKQLYEREESTDTLFLWFLIERGKLLPSLLTELNSGTYFFLILSLQPRGK